MEIDPQELVWPATVAMAASVAVATAVVIRIRRKQAVVPYEPRRRVPWHWPELLMVLAAAVVIGQSVAVLGGQWFHSPSAASRPPGAEELEKAHPLVVLLQVDRRAGVLLLVCLSGVLVAPITEEFFFRLLLQGWLEGVERRRRRRGEFLRRLVPGTMPVVAASLLFGAIHFRPVPPPTDPGLLVELFATSTVARVVTFGFAVWLLRAYSGASAADLGLVPAKLLGDAGLGLAAFLAIAAPLYAVQFALSGLLPDSRLVDPLTLTLFAAVLGTLYYRTHRIVPSIVLHMALNATSVAMAWWFLAR